MIEKVWCAVTKQLMKVQDDKNLIAFPLKKATIVPQGHHKHIVPVIAEETTASTMMGLTSKPHGWWMERPFTASLVLKLVGIIEMIDAFSAKKHLEVC
jgi:hypothetical protein